MVYNKLHKAIAYWQQVGELLFVLHRIRVRKPQRRKQRVFSIVTIRLLGPIEINCKNGKWKIEGDLSINWANRVEWSFPF